MDEEDEVSTGLAGEVEFETTNEGAGDDEYTSVEGEEEDEDVSMGLAGVVKLGTAEELYV